MRIGYACQGIGIPDTSLRTCQARNATPEALDEITAHNLGVLFRLLAYNARNGIRMFRITSDLVPFGSSPVNPLPWWDMHRETFETIGAFVREHDIRVSMHPGQYTVLNARESDVVHRAVLDLAYHARVLDLLGTGQDSKIILHVGGVYGNREDAMDRFADHWRTLDKAITRRLIIENDERSYPVSDVLALGHRLGIPVVFDNLHHRLNPGPETRTDAAWVAACGETWKKGDGNQKIHYSQQASGRRAGSHSDTIAVGPFLQFVASLPEPKPDIMLEVKDKNLSARKCVICADGSVQTHALESEWARYKYKVLEHDPAAYLSIRGLFRDHGTAPEPEKTVDRSPGARLQDPLPRQFYDRLDAALASDIRPGNAENAAQHVWGYFKGKVTEKEREAFFRQLARYRSGAASLSSVRRMLYKLAQTHGESYLLQSLYFEEWATGAQAVL